MFAAAVAIIGGHEADGAVPMFPVVPADEALDPSPCSLAIESGQLI